jgi:hypothetical protein
MGAIAKLRQRAEAAQNEADRLTKMVELADQLGDEGLAELVALVGSDEATNGNGNGHKAKPADPTAPRGREAVRIIVRDRPGIWTLAQLRAEMERRGWFTSAKGLEAAAKRLCDLDGEGKRAGRGRYVFPANHGEEVAIESDAADSAMSLPQFTSRA